MEPLIITEITVVLAQPKPDNLLRAFVHILLNDALRVNGLKIIEEPGHLWVCWPRSQDKKYRKHTVCVPTDRRVRAELDAVVLEEYARLAAAGKAVAA